MKHVYAFNAMSVLRILFLTRGQGDFTRGRHGMQQQFETACSINHFIKLVRKTVLIRNIVSKL